MQEALHVDPFNQVKQTSKFVYSPLHQTKAIKRTSREKNKEFKGQFHQRVNAQLLGTKIPKVKKESYVKQPFALLGSVGVKAVR